MTQDNYQKQQRDEMLRAFVRAVGIIFAFVLALALCALLSSCKTAKQTTIEEHKVEDIVRSVDSLICSRLVFQEDSAWHEIVLNQLQSIKEKNDTSHTIVLDTAGKIIKETLIIRTEKESSSKTDRQEREILMRRIEMMDSTMSVMIDKIQHSDSLLQQNEKEVEVAKPLTWWQKTRIRLGDFMLLALGIGVIIFAIKIKRKFLP